jgi:hypothetical protein
MWPQTSHSPSGPDPGLFKALRHFGLLQFFRELPHRAGQDRVDVVRSVVDSVVGDARLRKIVGPDLLRAVARSDQGAPLRGGKVDP